MSTIPFVSFKNFSMFLDDTDGLTVYALRSSLSIAFRLMFQTTNCFYDLPRRFIIVWRNCCWLSSSSSILCMPRFNWPTSSFDSLKCSPSHTWWSVVDWLLTLWEDTISSSSSNHAVVMVGLRDIQTLGSPNMAAEWFRPKLCITVSVATSYILIENRLNTAAYLKVAIPPKLTCCSEITRCSVLLRGPPTLESALRSAYCQSVSFKFVTHAESLI